MTAADHEYQRRGPMMVPGQLVYSAKMDLAKLERLYCCLCMWPVKSAMARRNYIDVYTTGVKTNAPMGCCCCLWCDHGNYLHYDDKRVGDFGHAGCCRPCPHPCPHFCNCCGEVLYLHQCFGCCTAGCPLMAGHCCTMTCFYCVASAFKLDVWCGLRVGEATQVANHVELAKRQGPGTVAQRAEIAVGQVLPMGGPQGQEMHTK